MLLFFFYELAFSIAHFLTPALSHTAVDMDPNRHRTHKSILCFRITETHNKKKKKRKVLQIMRSLVYLYETVTGFQRGRGCY